MDHHGQGTYHPDDNRSATDLRQSDIGSELRIDEAPSFGGIDIGIGRTAGLPDVIHPGQLPEVRIGGSQRQDFLRPDDVGVRFKP